MLREAKQLAFFLFFKNLSASPVKPSSTAKLTAKMQTLQTFSPRPHSLDSACVLPGWTNCPRCISSQTGGHIGFLLAAFMWLCIQVGQRWQCLLSARSLTLVGRCSLCTVFGLTLVFWANFWLCVIVYVCVWDREIARALMSSQKARGPGSRSGEEGDDSGWKLWRVTHKNTWEHWCHAAHTHTYLCTYRQKKLMFSVRHTFTLTHTKVFCSFYHLTLSPPGICMC